jgi:L-lysine exporter family protein LysE/ArgO
LIIAIGAQNAFLLRQGIRREHVLAVVTVCVLSDVSLYFAGAAGFGALARAMPWLIDWARWVGAAFLVGYGLLALRRSITPGVAVLRPSPDAARRVVATALALTWLNPHVYLDTVFLGGSVAATHGDGRWAFAAGASAASLAWFVALGYGARMLGRWLGSARAWRVLDTIVAAVMIATAVSLILSR